MIGCSRVGGERQAPAFLADVREAVLLLHGSAGTSSIWRRIEETLQPLYRVIAPDLIGYGGAALPEDTERFDIDAEIRAIEPLLCCTGRTHLVGYSYGGLVALRLALALPERVGMLTLIEPVFFSALLYAGEIGAYRRLQEARQGFEAKVGSGAREAAMADFVDFWAGQGAWKTLSAAQRSAMLGMALKIRLDWQAAFAFDPGRAGLARLAERTLLVRGSHSPEPMIRLVEALHRLMPGSRRTIIDRANHMLPLTHAPALSRGILELLDEDAERRLR
jgi:pimeloyl-ACP methyl ester carboxylesterase